MHKFSNSLIAPDVLTHDDLKKFSYVDSDKPSKQKTVNRKCQCCKDDEWKCKLNPYEKKN